MKGCICDQVHGGIVHCGICNMLVVSRYDCSSADLNPIGAISKNDLRKFLVWAAHNLGYGELMRVQAAPPTAELEPIRENENAQVKSATAFAFVGHIQMKVLSMHFVKGK